MPDEPRIDDWLDRWEGLRERGFALTPEEFLAGFRGEIPPPLAGEFVRRARALERMDRRMGQAGEGSGPAPRPGGGRSGQARARGRRVVGAGPRAFPDP